MGFRVFREHRMGTLHKDIAGCVAAIDHQREGDVGECKYRIEYTEGLGYHVWRRHIVGDWRCIDWAESHRRVECSKGSDGPHVKYYIELVG